jgi:hypothetical protein
MLRRILVVLRALVCYRATLQQASSIWQNTREGLACACGSRVIPYFPTRADRAIGCIHGTVRDATGHHTYEDCAP